MKTLFTTINLLLVLASISTISSNAQIFEIQIQSEDHFASPFEITHSKVVENSNNEFYFVGTTLDPFEGYNVILRKADINGHEIWSNEMDYGLRNDIGIDLVLTPLNEIVVLAASTDSTDSTSVYMALYDDNGIKSWDATYIRSNAKSQYPVGIICNNKNHFYLLSSSLMTTSLSDVSIAKVDAANGNIIWEDHYDEAGFDDFGAKLYFNNLGEIEVLSLAKDLSEDNGLLSLVYDNSGSQLSSSFTSYSNHLDTLMGFLQTPGGSTVLYGATLTDDDDLDMGIGLLDSNLNFEWFQTYNYVDKDEIVLSADLDLQGRICLAGSAVNDSLGEDLVLLRIDTGGALLDTLVYDPVIREDKIRPFQIRVVGDNIYLASTRYYSEQQQTGFDIHVFDDTLSPLWVTGWQNSVYVAKRIHHILVNEEANLITMFGLTDSSTYGKYTRLQWEWLKRELKEEGDTNLTYVASELLFEVQPENVLQSFSENTDMAFGGLYDALDSITVDSIIHQLDGIASIQDLKIIKLNPYFTPVDTQAMARTGKMVAIPPLYNQFILRVDGDINEFQASDKLYELDRINYCEINAIPQAFTAPNDTEYGNEEQAALAPTSTHANSHIGMEDAWDVQTGKSSIRIGVFDSGTNWLHHELTPDQNGDPNYSKCEGFDFSVDKKFTALQTSGNNFDTWDHGTNVSGVIGATSNNNFGVAGVAGGNWVNKDYGCELGIAKLAKDGDIKYLPVSEFTRAIYAFSIKANQYDLKPVDVMNHSYGVFRNFEWPFSFDHKDTSLISYAKSQRLMARLGVVNVAARGNAGNAVSSYPACFEDSWVINVGGFSNNRDVHPNASFGKGVDLIGPMDEDHICTIDPYTLTQIEYNFSGTSAAAPFVSGVAALVLSEFNDRSPLYENLSVEDIEYLLQKYTYTSNCSSYPDDKCGWGALNAKEVLEHMDYPSYRIDHFPKEGTAPKFLSSTPGSGIKIKLTEKWNGLSKGYYNATPIDYLIEFSHGLRSADSLLDYWLRPNFGTGLRLINHPSGDTAILPAIEGGQLVSCNRTKAVIKTRVYQINKGSSTYYYPGTWNKLDYSYGVHLYDPNATNGDFFTEVNEVLINHRLRVYPNPTNDILHITFTLEQATQVSFSLYDIRGVVHWTTSETLGEGRVKYQLDVSHLSTGVYILQMQSPAFNTQRRIVVE